MSRRAVVWGMAVSALGMGAPVRSLRAQGDPLPRLSLVETPRVGKTAPELMAPYATAGGPGPADQPFRLGAELGRVVVLLFGASDSLILALAHGPDSLFAGRRIVAAVATRDAPSVSAARAERLGVPYKFLTVDDPIVRRWGMNWSPAKGAVAWVVSPLGEIEGRVDGMTPDRDPPVRKLRDLIRVARTR